MRERAPKLVAILAAFAALASSAACKRDSATSSTTGGEEATDAAISEVIESPDAGVALTDAGVSSPRPDASVSSDGGTGLESAIAEAAASRWGASREEQCAVPPRPTISAAARASFDEGVALSRAGRLQEAVSAFNRALSQDRNSFAAVYNLGVISDRLGREPEALDYYRQALRIHSSYEDAIEAVVLIQLRRGRSQEALTFIEPLAASNSYNARIQAARARVLGALSRWDEAERASRRGLLCDERSVVALTSFAVAANGEGNSELADWVLDRIAQVEATEPPSRDFAESHLLRGTIARSRPGELERALREFTRAVDLRPDYVDARMALGQLMLSSGAYTDALEHLGAAATAAPWAWQVRLAYADALRAVRRYDDAKREIESIFVLSPDQPEVHLSLGFLYMEQTNCLRTTDVSSIPNCQRAVAEFTAYRRVMGSRLPASDRTQEYVTSLNRIITRLTNARDAAARDANREQSEEP